MLTSAKKKEADQLVIKLTEAAEVMRHSVEEFSKSCRVFEAINLEMTEENKCVGPQNQKKTTE